jgi:hypothetical protein
MMMAQQRCHRRDGGVDTVGSDRREYDYAHAVVHSISQFVLFFRLRQQRRDLSDEHDADRVDEIDRDCDDQIGQKSSESISPKNGIVLSIIRD